MPSAYAVAVNTAGNAFIAGTTKGTGFPSTGTAGTPGNDDAFVAKMNVAGTAFDYADIIGGTDMDSANGIRVDTAGRAIVTGMTKRNGFPELGTHGALGGQDGFLLRLAADGASIQFSDVFGGAMDDQGNAIALDSIGNPYIAGTTKSSGFPTTTGACDEVYNGGKDAFAMKFITSATLTVTKTLVPSSDPGKFNLQIDGSTAGTGANVGDTGTTGPIAVSSATHTVAETAGTSTTLSDYITTIGGDCAANGSITLADGDNKTCTITNARKPKLTVTKTLVPAADPGRFNLRIDGLIKATDVPTPGNTSTGAVTLDTLGFHTVDETAGAGRSLTNYLGVIGGDCLSTGHITLAAGDDKTCTITNYRNTEITSLTAQNLPLADRRMVLVTVVPTTLNPATCTILPPITPNTPQQGSLPDVILHLPLAAELRAERPVSGVNRSYTIVVSCSDGVTTATDSVMVKVLGVR